MPSLRRSVLAAAVSAVTICSACSSSSSGSRAQPTATVTVTATVTATVGADGQQSSTPGGALVHDASEIVALLHLTGDDLGGYTFHGAGGLRCPISVILTSKGQVDTYDDPGSGTVAKNPSGTAGVKVVTQQQKSCFEALTAALRSVP